MNIKERIDISEHDIIMMELLDLMKEADQKTKNISLSEGKKRDTIFDFCPYCGADMKMERERK